MPSLNPGVPAVMPVDVTTFMDALDRYGMDWLSDIAWNMPSTSIDMTALAAGPPPPPQVFGTAELTLGMLPTGPWSAQTQERMIGLVKSYLYDINVVATPGDPPPAPVLVPAPPDVPPPAIPPPLPDWHDDNIHWIVGAITDLKNRMVWQASQLPTRQYLVGDNVEFTGDGHYVFPVRFSGTNEYSVYPMGMIMAVSAHPIWEGTSSGGFDALHYGLGDISWGVNGFYGHPIKLMHLHQLILAGHPFTSGFKYNLKLGVTIVVQPVYPVQFIGDVIE